MNDDFKQLPGESLEAWDNRLRAAWGRTHIKNMTDAEYRAAKAKAIATAHNPPPPPALRNALELSPAEYRREKAKLGIYR